MEYKRAEGTSPEARYEGGQAVARARRRRSHEGD